MYLRLEIGGYILELAPRQTDTDTEDQPVHVDSMQYPDREWANLEAEHTPPLGFQDRG